MKTNRLFAATALTAALVGCATQSEVQPLRYAALPVEPLTPEACPAYKKVPFQLGIAGWSFHKQTLDETLEICRMVKCRNLCHKDYFLPYEATDAELAAFKEKLASYGVTMDATGPHYADSEKELRKEFDFAKRAGLKMIVGVPFRNPSPGKEWDKQEESDEVLDIVEKLVKEYDIKYAIHNHGPDIPKLFPSAATVWKRIEKRDSRIGFCLDVAHEMRTGADPVKSIRQYGSRIYDVHMHNVKSGTPKFVKMRCPYGDVDAPAVMKALAEVGYSGVVHIEYSREPDAPLVGLAEAMGYYLGCMQSVKAKLYLEPTPANANTLTDAEKAEGWKLLWDGKSEEGWVGVKTKCQSFPRPGWKMQNGTLTMTPQHTITDDGKWADLPPEDMKLGGAGDIVTVKKYRNFILKFDFRMTERANSGVKYFFDETTDSASCEEYQVLDSGHPDYDKGKNGNRQIAALYDLIPAPLAEKAVKPCGRWNSGMIVSKNNHIEHWLNGVKVVEYERGSEAFRALVKQSKYAKWGKDAAGNPRAWGENPEGRILIQDHTDSTVSFCNIKILELK